MSAAAILILAVHAAIIVFNVAGLVLIPLGAWRGWCWVRGFGWRLLHLLCLATVAAQALAGRACFLTVWQMQADGEEPAQPLIAGWINRLIYWPLPLWVFTVLYALVLLYVLWLWRQVPPRLPWKTRSVRE